MGLRPRHTGGKVASRKELDFFREYPSNCLSLGNWARLQNLDAKVGVTGQYFKRFALSFTISLLLFFFLSSTL